MPNRIHDPERLDALKRSGLLDKSLTQRLELLAATAAELLRVPVSLVNVVDGEEQTTVGGFPPDLTGRRMQIEDTGCQHVVMAGEPVSIPNTLLHPQMCISPLVTVIGIRSYLGVPVYWEGEVVGSFCVADYVVRDWGFWEIQSLKGVARLAGLSVDA